VEPTAPISFVGCTPTWAHLTFLLFLFLFFIFVNPSYIQLTPQKLSAGRKNHPGAPRRRRVARRPSAASREKTRPPPVSEGSSPLSNEFFVCTPSARRKTNVITYSFCSTNHAEGRIARTSSVRCIPMWGSSSRRDPA